MTFSAEQVAADEQAARISALEGLAGLAHSRSEERRRQEIDGLIEEERVRQQVAAVAQGIAAMEDANLRQRLAAHQTFTGRMAEMYGTQMDGIGALADFTKSAFQTMGTAVGDHVTAMVTGRESVGTALQGMASDMLLAVGKQAMVKGAFELAEGFGALAGVVTAPLAPGHFAASAAYFAVGALASAAGAAIAPAATTAAPSSASAKPSGERASNVTPRGGAGSEGGTVINVNFGGSTIVGGGGARGAAREIANVLNDGARLGGVRLSPGLMGAR